MRNGGLFMLFGVVIAVGAFPGAQPEERALHLYSAFDGDETKLFVDAFQSDSGVHVRWESRSTADLFGGVRSAEGGPTTSVAFGGPSRVYIDAEASGLLARYRPKLDFELSDSFHAPDWSWSGFCVTAVGFISNRNFLDKNGVSAPGSWRDLLNPAFKRNVVVAYPYASDASYTALATLVELYGLDEALGFWAALDGANIVEYPSSSSACIPKVGLGEAAVGIAFSHEMIAKGVAKGYPVVVTFPKEGTGYETSGIALLEGAPEPELGKQFVDWIFSKRAQDLLQAACRLPLNPDASVTSGGVPVARVKLMRYDDRFAGLNKERFVQAWRDRIGK